jgi:diguanylate cyclase (GGDEF)-like protein
MSFRTRLTLFFVLIVIVPMFSAAVIVFRLISDNETGKADAKLAQGETAARSLYTQYIADASRAMERVGTDPEVGRALRTGDRALLDRRLTELANDTRLERLTVVAGTRTLSDVGSRDATASARRELIGAGGQRVARMHGSTITADAYAQQLTRLTSLETIVRSGGKTLAATGPAFADDALPTHGTLKAGGKEYRVATFSARGFDRAPVRVATLSDSAAVADSVASARLVAGAALVGFLALAFAFGIAVSRSLSAQIGGLLEAARRIGGGDFSVEVPIHGHDEFAQLSEQFNLMSRQLAARLEELRQERQRLETSIRRAGDSFASNLDRTRLLEIVVNTAVDGVGATCGRASLRDDPAAEMEERVHAGEVDPFAGVLDSAERQALATLAPAEAALEGYTALALPLSGQNAPDRVLGLISVARAERPFTGGERDLFNYLAGRAAVSLENVDLHDLVKSQAVTDELTGLFNHRKFQELASNEAERAKRFDNELGLVMIDIDDFKRVNDSYGHQQGDVVLREVGRVLRESTREIDEASRYGGEEFTVILPQTDLDGAFHLGERIRQAIEALQVERLDGKGVVRVTVSAGVSAMPESARDKSSLIDAADAALYEAKRAGKNRTARAASARTPPVAGGYA